jgi:2,4-dienoyl-CoA reductase-like NADH-dependent reductase (Old Yellow Enzyme family)
MIAVGYDRETAEGAITSGRTDIVAFGRPFIANPDLPGRLRDGHPPNTADSSSFFGDDDAAKLYRLPGHELSANFQARPHRQCDAIRSEAACCTDCVA